MERVLNGDDKIRRAEEIYYRRKMGLPAGTRNFEPEKKSYLGSKIFLEILIILNISIIVVAIQNKDFIFTEEFLSLMSEYNVNLTESIKGMISEEDALQQNVANENPVENDEVPQEVNNEEQQTEQEPAVQEALVPNEDSSSSLSQMDLDIEEINRSYSFQKPLDVEGTVTSPFGSRESVYQNVTGYHTGIDIGADKGTSIKAAHEGYVILTSSKGDYGKHIKIENGYLQTLYAHCSKILVKEGEYVNVGQEIAKVGSTGNSTGPHLHFEIRYSERFVDPSRIISF